jgi:isochorismate hydrolase
MQKWKDVAESLNTHEWFPAKAQTGILFIDCQKYFRGLISPVLKNITRVIEAAHKSKLPLFFTQHGHPPNEDPGLLGEWWADVIIEGSESSELLPELGMRPEDPIIKKDRYSAFYKTDLEETLRAKGIKDLIIVRDFRVFFLVDGTSTANADFHLATLKNLSYGFATLLTCDQAVSLLS